MSLSLIGVLTYIAVLRGLASQWIGVKLGAIIAAGFPFLVNLAISAIYVFGMDLPVVNLVPLVLVVTAIIQLVVCLVVFAIMQQRDDNIVAWLTIAGLGLVTNYAVIPYVVSMLI